MIVTDYFKNSKIFPIPIDNQLNVCYNYISTKYSKDTAYEH